MNQNVVYIENALTKMAHKQKNYCQSDDCKIRVLFDFQCKFCKKQYCGRHRIPEEHKCNEMKEWKDEAKRRIESKLDEEKTGRNKI